MTGYHDALAALQAARLSVAMLARDQEFLQVAGKQMILYSLLIVALLLVFGGIPFMDNRPSNPTPRRPLSRLPPRRATPGASLPAQDDPTEQAGANNNGGFGELEDEFFQDPGGGNPTPEPPTAVEVNPWDD